MPNIIKIQDLSMPELDIFTRLTETQLRSRLEPEKGVFIAQSTKITKIALDRGCLPVSILAERRQLESAEGAAILERVGDIPVYMGERCQLESLTGYALTRGLLCAFRRPVLPELSQLCQNARRIAVLDGVVDSTNVGAIIRSAAALGMDAVVTTSAGCDPLNRRSVRVSMGTLFQIPWTIAPSGPKGSAQPWMSQLQELGFKTVAMALRKDTVSIDDPALMKEEKLAVILGSEGWGLAEETIDQCDYTVRIPMFHGVDSLNVAAASAVAFWQLRSR